MIGELVRHDDDELFSLVMFLLHAKSYLVLDIFVVLLFIFFCLSLSAAVTGFRPLAFPLSSLFLPLPESPMLVDLLSPPIYIYPRSPSYSVSTFSLSLSLSRPIL